MGRTERSLTLIQSCAWWSDDEQACFVFLVWDAIIDHLLAAKEFMEQQVRGSDV